jgi:uncharacterized protein
MSPVTNRWQLVDGALRVVVVADTHSNPHVDGARHIAAVAPHLILHAGDIGRFEVLDELRKLAPVLAVRGNIDTPVREIPEALCLEVADGERVLAKILMVHIGVNGPKLRADVARLAASEGATMVTCGHSHVPFIGRDRNVSVFNPGSIGPRRFMLPIVFGVIELDSHGIKMRHVDCETGLTWTPQRGVA